MSNKAISVVDPRLPDRWEAIEHEEATDDASTDGVAWRGIPEKTQEHWLEVEDPEGWYSAAIRFDGCIHFHRYYNTPKHLQTEGDKDSDMTDYLHICDIDDMISRLRTLKALAVAHFGSDWLNK